MNGIHLLLFALAIVGWGAFLEAMWLRAVHKANAASWRANAERLAGEVASVQALLDSAHTMLRATVNIRDEWQGRALLAEATVDLLNRRSVEDYQPSGMVDPAAMTDELPAVDPDSTDHDVYAIDNGLMGDR